MTLAERVAAAQLSKSDLRLLAEWESSLDTTAAELAAAQRELRQARANYAKALRTIDALTLDLTRAQDHARPLSAADVAVRWGLPLTHARRVWRAIKESR